MTKYENLAEAVNWIKLVKKINKDIAIAITGREQSGKSTLALKIGKILNDGKLLDLEKHIGYDLTESLKELRNIPDNSIYILDEAIRVAYNRRFMSQGNIQINTLMRQLGSKKCTVFFVMPNFWEMDSSLRDRRVAIWIHCLGPSQINRETNKPERFEAVMFEPNEHAFDKDKWSLEHEYGKIKKARKRGSPYHISISTTIQSQVKLYSGISNYTKCFSYAPLPDDYFIKYKAMSDARKFEEDKDVAKHGTQLMKNKEAVNRLMVYLHEQCGLNARKISEIIDGVYGKEQVRNRIGYSSGLYPKKEIITNKNNIIT